MRKECTRPDLASTTKCSFMPKCQWLPYQVECISGSRVPCWFLVELGAAIIEASSDVPFCNQNHWNSRWRLNSANRTSPRWCACISWRKSRMVVPSGTRSRCIPARCRTEGTSRSISSMAGRIWLYTTCPICTRNSSQTHSISSQPNEISGGMSLDLRSGQLSRSRVMARISQSYSTLLGLVRLRHGHVPPRSRDSQGCIQGT